MNNPIQDQKDYEFRVHVELARFLEDIRIINAVTYLRFYAKLQKRFI